MQIGKRPHNPGRKRNLTKAERRVIWDQLAKKYLKSKGYLKPKEPAKWLWECDDQGGFVFAFTCGEARSKIKEALGLPKSKRLPIGVQIYKEV